MNGLSIVVGFDVFSFVSYRIQPFQNSTLLILFFFEPDIELHEE